MGESSPQSRFVKFAFLVLFGIISTACGLYVIYYFIKISSYRKRFQNQTLIILVFIVVFNTSFNIPTTFSYFIRGYTLLQTKSFCYVWRCIDYSFTASIIWCKAVFTLERYVFVFNPKLLRSRRQRFLFHHIPLIGIHLYLILFYILNTLLNQCDDEIDYSELLCGEQCLDEVGPLSIMNWIFNILFPTFIIVFGSFILLLRVLWTRREMQRNLRNWSKNWKMIVQLLGVACIYTIVWLPIAVITLIKIFKKGPHGMEDAEHVLYFLTYLCEMSIPIIALFLTPEIMRKLHEHPRPSIIHVAPGSIAPYSTH